MKEAVYKSYRKSSDPVKSLTMLKIIPVEQGRSGKLSGPDFIKKYKGAMFPQPISDVDKQLDDLRREWG